MIDPDIVVNEQDQLECIGKIHGKVYGNYEIYGTCEEDETIPEHEIEINKKAESCAIFGTRFCFFIFIPEQVPVLSLH